MACADSREGHVETGPGEGWDRFFQQRCQLILAQNDSETAQKLQASGIWLVTVVKSNVKRWFQGLLPILTAPGELTGAEDKPLPLSV